MYMSYIHEEMRKLGFEPSEYKAWVSDDDKLCLLLNGYDIQDTITDNTWEDIIGYLKDSL